jgi:hypothetical protein
MPNKRDKARTIALAGIPGFLLDAAKADFRLRDQLGISFQEWFPRGTKPEPSGKPHQGAKECARRVRQIERGIIQQKGG